MCIIDMKDVCYSYDKVHPALNNLNLTIEQGERIAILGPNGAGKSTLLQLLNGLITPDSGQVIVDGLSVERRNFTALRRRVGVVFQNSDDQLFNSTVEREVAYGLNNIGIRGESLDSTIEWALNIVGMDGYRDRNPFSLSGGEKKRIALASVIAMKPKILVLDEPFSGLDPQAASQLVGTLNKINSTFGMTLIFTLHDMDIVPLVTDKIHLLNKGERLFGGTREEFFRQKKLIRQFDLRLPRVAHLAELLIRDGYIPEQDLPLKIGEAKKMLQQLFNEN